MKNKKLFSVISTTMLLALLTLTACDDSSGGGTPDLKPSVYSYTAGQLASEEGITIPPGGMTLNELFQQIMGITYDSYLSLVGGTPLLYKNAALTQPFNGSDRLYPNTMIYSSIDLMGGGSSHGAKIGEITGTITLTDVPNPKPKSVSISVSGFDNVTWRSDDSRINITGSGTLSNISWSIPIYEDDGFFPSTGNFSLRIELTNNNSFSIGIPTTKTISSVNANVGSLGTVSLKTITLSGTINVTCNGQVVPYVEIMASASSTSAYGYTTLTSPVANASWSITMPALSSSTQVNFSVYGMSSSGTTLFFVYNTSSVNAYNTNVSGITLNLGNKTSP